MVWSPCVRALGLRTGVLHYALLLLLSLVVVSALQSVGAILVIALLVTPAVIARMLTNSFARMLWIAPSIGAVCGFTGMLLSYYIDVSSGATIILMASSVFLVVYAITGTRGRRNVAGLAHGH